MLDKPLVPPYDSRKAKVMRKRSMSLRTPREDGSLAERQSGIAQAERGFRTGRLKARPRFDNNAGKANK